MRNTIAAAASAALVLLWAGLAAAHHSAVQFDFANSKTVEGIVVKFDVVNPHTEAVLTVTDEKGTRDVSFEGHSANNFYRSGWRKGMVNVGDKIKITYAPMRNGTEGGFITGFTTADGQEIGFKMPGVTAPAAAGAPEASTPPATSTTPPATETTPATGGSN